MNTKIFSVTEDITDCRLKDGGCIDENKGYYKLLIMATRSVPLTLPLTPLSEPDEMINITKVDLCEHFGPLQMYKRG